MKWDVREKILLSILDFNNVIEIKCSKPFYHSLRVYFKPYLI